MTDIVYILGSGSLWQNNELRYSLRSVEKHLSGVGNIYCIGHCPDWVDATHISFADQIPSNTKKAENIKNKILAACEDERISDPFLVFSDDYFLLQDYPADSYPYFYRGMLEEGAALLKPIELYRRVYWNTIKLLREKNLPEKHFNVHAPILYSKAKAKQALSIPDWSTPLGFMSKSIYCNYWGIEGEYQKDCKVSKWIDRAEIEKTVHDSPFFTISDRALFRGRDLWMPLVDFLKETYPNKSRWEK